MGSGLGGMPIPLAMLLLNDLTRSLVDDSDAFATSLEHMVCSRLPAKKNKNSKYTIYRYIADTNYHIHSHIAC
jgi:hypothetical protein